MARKPKTSPPARHDDRAAEPQWQKENQSLQSTGSIRWFSAHEFTTSEDTLRTPKAEEKPGIGAPSARQERDAVPNESDAVTRPRRSENTSSPNERPTRHRRRASARPRRDAPPRNRRAR